MNTTNLKKILIAIFAIFLVYSASSVLLRGGGLDSPSIRDTILFSILIIILCSSCKAYRFILIPFVVLISIYAPVGFLYGKPSFQYVASLFYTDLNEGSEFLSQIPVKYFIVSILPIILIAIFKKITKKFDINLYKNKTFLIASVIISLTNQTPTAFIRSIINSTKTLKEEIAKVDKYNKKSEWSETKILSEQGYDDYILIIGESARKDYHHLYGYPVSNTPFLDSVNGYFIDGLTAGGNYTIGSLRLMLTKPDSLKWEPNYNLDLISLINDAGIDTYWISNQGQFGNWDAPISSIAKKSNVSFFLKKGKYDDKNTSDFDLIPYFNDLLNKKSNKKRFFVIHLYGSHPDACDRVSSYQEKYNVGNKKYNYIGCYVSSIKQTDLFIKNIYDELMKSKKNNNRTFSLIYFSDHGLSHRDIDDKIYINNNLLSKYHYDIPLIKLSSNDTSRTYIKVNKSGLNFTNGIASWIGIKNKELNNKYNLFDDIDDDDYGLADKLKNSKTIDDPAINIKEYISN